MRRIRMIDARMGVAAAGLLAFAALLIIVPPLPAQVTCEPSQRIGPLPPELVEASGITRDPRRADVLWLHNDSGHRPGLYAVDLSGRLIGVAPIEDMPAVDLEDIAVGRCDSRWCVFLADIGDNVGIRPFMTVYQLPLPRLPSAGAEDAETTAGSANVRDLPAIAPEAAFTYHYPDGSRDAESLVVDWERGEVVIISKGRSGRIGLYSGPIPAADASEGSRTLTLRGVLPIPADQGIGHQATAADLSPDGSLLAVRTYLSLYLFTWRGAEAFDPDVTPFAMSLATIDEPQGEGVAFDADGTRLYLASEGQRNRGPLLSFVQCATE